MASVHLGQLLGSVGFARTVAIKRLHAQFAKDPAFVSMFLDEARLAARIRHPCVIPTLDVVTSGEELFLVMEYVQGEALSRLVLATVAQAQRVPVPVVLAIASNVLQGLHAAHETRGEAGHLLNIVHRDVSPQNVLVGEDGVARVFDFGVAKAAGRLHTTRSGQFKGKLRYSAPEQFTGEPVGRTADVYSASVVLWEMLTGARMHDGDSSARVIRLVLDGDIRPPCDVFPDLPHMLDEAVMRGLQRDPHKRFPSARDMALAIECCGRAASPMDVAAWVAATAGDELAKRADEVSSIERLQNVALDDVRSSLSELMIGRAVEDASRPCGTTAQVEREDILPARPPDEQESSGGSAVATTGGPDTAMPSSQPRSRRVFVALLGAGLVAAVALAVVTLTRSLASAPSAPPSESSPVAGAKDSVPPTSSATAPDAPSASSSVGPSPSTAAAPSGAPTSTPVVPRKTSSTAPRPPAVKAKGKTGDGLFDRD